MLAIYLHVYACLHIAKEATYIYILNSLYGTFTVCPCIVIDAYRTLSLADLQRGHTEGKLYKAEEKIKQLKEQIRD